MTDDDLWKVNQMIQEALKNSHVEPSPKTLAMFIEIRRDLKKLTEMIIEIIKNK